jgi:hypothetical protein
MIRHSTLLLALTLAACGGEPAETPTTKDNAVKPAKTEAAPAKKLAKFDAATLKAEALKVALVPSPAEMQKALGNAGLESQLSALVQKRDISVDVENKDQVAVRTGVILADLVLTVKEASNEEQLQRLARIKQGFALLGAGGDVAATIDELSGKIKSGSGSKDDLLKEFDELSGVLVPELEYEAGDWVVPLIQAGSWLEGAHLVAGAVKAEGKFDEASKLLKQPHVVQYFIDYVEREGKEKAPDQVISKLKETLTTLKETTSKTVIEEEDVNTIHSATAAVLTML